MRSTNSNNGIDYDISLAMKENVNQGFEQRRKAVVESFLATELVGIRSGATGLNLQ